MKIDSASQPWILMHAEYEKGFVPGTLDTFKAETELTTTTTK
jgi:hypothetical protein